MTAAIAWSTINSNHRVGSYWPFTGHAVIILGRGTQIEVSRFQNSVAAMPRAEIDVSYVVSIYNKSFALDAVLDSLAHQEGDFRIEYIFVDDASDDDSLEILRRKTIDWPDVTILENTTRAGPAVRVNQGARKASGRYLCLFDADVVLAPDAMATMLNLLESHDADAVHGRQQKLSTRTLPAAPQPIGLQPSYRVDDNAFNTVLSRGFNTMTWMVCRSLFEHTGGCDERLFVQDESLRIRLGHYSRRLVDLREIVSCTSLGGEHQSHHKSQQHHDYFFAYYFFAADTPSLTSEQQFILYRRCVSVAWKSLRRRRLTMFACCVFLRYAATYMGYGKFNESTLRPLVVYFQTIPGIRKPQLKNVL